MDKRIDIKDVFPKKIFAKHFNATFKFADIIKIPEKDEFYLFCNDIERKDICQCSAADAKAFKLERTFRAIYIKINDI